MKPKLEKEIMEDEQTSFRQKLIGVSAILVLLLLIVLIFYVTFNHLFPGL